jgi:hypothetical protein
MDPQKALVARGSKATTCSGVFFRFFLTRWKD